MKPRPLSSRVHDVRLIDIREVDGYLQLLYDLLAERTQEQSISHVKMPTWEEHVAFVRRYPSFPKAWYFIVSKEDGVVGATYITRQAEIGVFIFKAHQKNGYGKWAVEAVMERWKRSPFNFIDKRPIPVGMFFANVSPGNDNSLDFFKHLGYYPHQVTLTCVRS